MSARSLRYYEDEGLIVPGRCRNGYRDYCRSTIDRVLVVRSLLESGLPVSLIKEILSHHSDGADCAVPLCEEFLDKVSAYRDRLSARITELSAQRSAVDAYLRVARQIRR